MKNKEYLKKLKPRKRAYAIRRIFIAHMRKVSRERLQALTAAFEAAIEEFKQQHPDAILSGKAATPEDIAALDTAANEFVKDNLDGMKPGEIRTANAGGFGFVAVKLNHKTEKR